MNRKVDIFLSKATKWQEEFEVLREIALESGLTEELKWGQPCYTFNGANIFLIGGFKNYCALLFMKGVLLDDPEAILIAQTENVQSGRQIRFTSVQEINKMRKTLKAYISHAIEVERSGKKVEMKKSADFVIPAEITAEFKKISGLSAAFKKLTPGRQRAYVLYFTSAKQLKTRDSRIRSSAPRILSGKGLNDE